MVIFANARIDYMTEHMALEALERKIPIVFSENGFLNSIEPFMGKSGEKFIANHSIMLDQGGLYLNAHIPSRVENILNSDWQMTDEELSRAKELINVIRKEKLSKYNCQPLGIKWMPSSKNRILVIDQVYGDKSIEFGFANDESTFREMLTAAIEDNPGADIYIKVHPVRSRGHFAWVKEKDNLHILDMPMNPIELLEQMNKAYVVSSQMGFEAVMCGCEVHCFGMPFYAGWGATKDKIVCSRRKKSRTVEEIFYAAYIMATTYVSCEDNTVCELEKVIEEILELRGVYFQGLPYDK